MATVSPAAAIAATASDGAFACEIAWNVAIEAVPKGRIIPSKMDRFDVSQSGIGNFELIKIQFVLGASSLQGPNLKWTWLKQHAFQTGIDTANKSCNWPVGKPNFVHKGVVKAVG